MNFGYTGLETYSSTLIKSLYYFFIPYLSEFAELIYKISKK